MKTTTLAILSVLCLTSLAAAQGEAIERAPKAPPPGPAPRTADGKIDFSGIWSADRRFIYDINDALKKGDTLPIQPWALKTTLERVSKDDPEALCLPAGVPRQAPYPWRIVQTQTHLFFLFEGNIHSYRQIFMDGRPHPPDLDPTWYGHSIGKWEGDTLVVDTVGYNDRFWFDFDGHPHSTQLHTIERFTRTDANTLKWDITIQDPGAYAKPFTVQTQARYEPSWELMEYICNENNTNVDHIVGPAKVVR
jgi:hypothetical protein